MYDQEKIKKMKNHELAMEAYFYGKRQVICWIENHIKKIDNYIEN